MQQQCTVPCAKCAYCVAALHCPPCALCTVQAEAEESLFLQLAAALLCRVPASAELQIRPPPAGGVTEAVKPVNWSLAVQGVKV